MPPRAHQCRRDQTRRSALRGRIVSTGRMDALPHLLSDNYDFTDIYGTTLNLTLECFNAVDGWAKLVILFGWFRSVCSNGLVIGETKITIRERHGQHLDLAAVPTRIQSAFEAARTDCARLKRWQAAPVSIESIATWVNNAVSKQWGKKAAVRVFHICDTGTDVEITDLFASGPVWCEKAAEARSVLVESPK